MEREWAIPQVISELRGACRTTRCQVRMFVCFHPLRSHRDGKISIFNSKSDHGPRDCNCYFNQHHSMETKRTHPFL